MVWWGWGVGWVCGLRVCAEGWYAPGGGGFRSGVRVWGFEREWGGEGLGEEVG